MDFMDAVNAFLDYAQNIKNYQKTTLVNYRGIFRRFASEQTIKNVSDITLETIERYASELKRQGKSQNYVFNVITAIRAFIRYLNRQDATSVPFSLIEVPRREFKPVETLGIEEVQAVIDNIGRERDRLMALILFTSGIRVNELVNLKAEDVDGQSLRIVGKGNKPRLCYIHEYVAQRLHIYMSMEGINQGHIFLSTSGKTIGPAAVRFAIKKAAQKAGLNRRVYPHLFRHTFATMMLRSGSDLITIKELLGHDQLQTTQRYLNVSDPWKKAQYDQHKPQITLYDPSANYPQQNKKAFDRD